MKKILQKAGILFLIFIGALVVYFISARNTMEKESAVYTSMEEPSLPVVYTQLGGQEINCLHGYMQDMGNQAARESISVLPEDRGLNIRIEEYGNTITGISYEVRNLTLAGGEDRSGRLGKRGRKRQRGAPDSKPAGQK